MLGMKPIYNDLRTIWSRLLNLNTISENSDFFLLGGNQKLVIELIAQIKRKLDLHVTVREITENSRFDKQISLLNAYLARDNHVQYQTYPITIEQQSILTIDKLRAGQSTEYNIGYRLSLDAPVDACCLEQSILKLVAKHTVLRSYFPNTNGNVLVKLIDPAKIKFDILVNVIDNLNEKLQALISEPFNLEQEAAICFYLILTSKQNENKDTLLIVHHQIIHDGDSCDLMINDFMNFYSGSRDHANQIHKKNSLSYIEWAQIQKKELCLEESLAYWKKKLDGYQPTQLEIGTAWKPRIGNQGYVFCLKLEDLKVQKALYDIASQCQTSIFTILLGIFYILLERYCEQLDLTIATLISNKRDPRLQNTVGFFLNTLLLRVQLDLKKSFLKFICDDVKPTILEALTHAQISPDMIPMERRSSSLFHIVLCYHDLGEKNHTIHQSKLVSNGTTKYDLSIDIFSLKSGFEFQLCGSSELYHPHLIEDFARNYLQTIEYITSHQDNAIANYHLKFRDVTIPNRIWEKKDFDHNSTILDAFYQTAQNRSDKKQIEFNNEFLTVSNFWQKVQVKSNRLRDIFKQYLQHELLPGECIGIASSRSLETLSDMVAILFAGGAFVPYNPNDPKERIHYVLNNANVKLKLCHGIVHFNEHDLSIPLIQETDYNPTLPTTSIKAPLTQLAYLMHTSGSSGLPKGVKISHRALWHYYKWFGSFEFIQTSKRFDFSTNLTFDASMTTTLVALAYGKTISVCPEEIKNSPSAFLQYLIQKKIDFCKCTPSYFRLLLNESQISQVKISQTMNWLLTGEEMSPHDTAAWLELHPHHIFYNSYGPTEATVTCSKFKIDRHNINNFITNIPIEMNSRACHFHIVDTKMRQVPHGIKGELCIEGPILADGYQNKPQETNKSFVKGENGCLWYRTGDLVMSRPNGSIFYFGRTDNQVKIRGIRVELEEIRYVICSLDDISDAKVIVNKVQGIIQIFAFIVPKHRVSDASSFCNKVQHYLLTKIPAAITPEHLIILEKLPSNLAGKVDIQSLRAIAENSSFKIGKMLVANPLEMSLLQIWRESLPPNKIGTDTNFFHLGGHSLLAMVVMDKINRYLNSSLPPNLIFQKPTIRELGQAICNKQANHNLHHLCHSQNGPVLFLIHPATGMAHVYHDLRESLREIDFYALSNDRFGDLQSPYASIEEMASSYIKTLTMHCPKGPYIIGGFCTGGVVAFEMIRQLESAGQGPCALILIDSFKLHDLGSQQERDTYNKSQLELKGINENSDLGQKLVYELNHNRNLVVNYHLEPYTGRCLFLKCKHLDPEDIHHHSLKQLKKYDNGWALSLTSALVKKIEINATHRTLFRDATIIQNVGKEISQFCLSLSKN